MALSTASPIRLAPALGVAAVVLGLAVAACGEQPPGEQVAQSGRALDGAEIVDRLRDAYGGCRTYRDSGEVVLTYGQPGLERSLSWTFNTAFRAPKLRFAFGQGPGVPVSEAVSEGAGCLWAQPDADSPIQGLSGTPGLQLREFLYLDAMSTIPALLAADQVGPGWWPACETFHRAGVELIGGATCLVINGDCRPPLTKLTLWIDAEQFMLRRKEIQFTIGSLQGRARTDYQPQPNADVTAEEVAYRG